MNSMTIVHLVYGVARLCCMNLVRRTVRKSELIPLK